MFCPNCGNQLQAEKFCPKCGNPTKALDLASPAAGPIEVIETRKRGKNLQLAGGLIFLIGLFVLIGSCARLVSSQAGEAGDAVTASFAISLLFVVAGAIIYYWGKFQHWYHHE